MAGKREQKKEALRTALIEAAQKRIISNGLVNLRARDIAADAKCALGSLYTAFEDIDALILTVNSITLGELGETLEDAVTATATPSDEMLALGKAYLNFALEHKNAWKAVFTHTMVDENPVPEKHQMQYAVLFEKLSRPLTQLQPHASEREIDTQTQILLAAVHGIVSISIEGRYFGVSVDKLQEELDRFVLTYIRGLK